MKNHLISFEGIPGVWKMNYSISLRDYLIEAKKIPAFITQGDKFFKELLKFGNIISNHYLRDRCLQTAELNGIVTPDLIIYLYPPNELKNDYLRKMAKSYEEKLTQLREQNVNVAMINGGLNKNYIEAIVCGLFDRLCQK